MKEKVIKAKFKRQTGHGRDYKLIQLVGAVTVTFTNKGDNHKPFPDEIRINDRIDESYLKDFANNRPDLEITVV